MMRLFLALLTRCDDMHGMVALLALLTTAYLGADSTVNPSPYKPIKASSSHPMHEWAGKRSFNAVVLI